MPKIKHEEIDEEEFEEDEEDFDEDELEQEEVKRVPSRKPIQKKPAPQEPKMRFGLIAEQPLRLVDAESGEVFGEGEHLVPMVLTNILERLERIENSIGSMMEG